MKKIGAQFKRTKTSTDTDKKEVCRVRKMYGLPCRKCVYVDICNSKRKDVN